MNRLRSVEFPHKWRDDSDEQRQAPANEREFHQTMGNPFLVWIARSDDKRFLAMPLAVRNQRLSGFTDFPPGFR